MKLALPQPINMLSISWDPGQDLLQALGRQDCDIQRMRYPRIRSEISRPVTSRPETNGAITVVHTISLTYSIRWPHRHCFHTSSQRLV